MNVFFCFTYFLETIRKTTPKKSYKKQLIEIYSDTNLGIYSNHLSKNSFTLVAHISCSQSASKKSKKKNVKFLETLVILSS